MNLFKPIFFFYIPWQDLVCKLIKSKSKVTCSYMLYVCTMYIIIIILTFAYDYSPPGIYNLNIIPMLYS